ncbi:MAG: ABC transporter ATP-binding protein [Planctomycetota bacterium]
MASHASNQGSEQASMEGRALIEATALHHVYGQQVAVDGLDLRVHAGEVVGLLGPNGAGKTTTVRALVGLLTPTSGAIRIAGQDLHADPLAAKRHLGYVPDGAPLYPNLSAMQHLMLVGRLHGMSDAAAAAEGMRLLEHLDLADRATEPVGRFSRGMRQKAALACALIHAPEVLVLDEPLTGLDAPSAAMVKEVLRAWADRGGAVLYTSHLLDVVERVCDRMVIMAQGALVGEGSLNDLRTRAGRDGTLEQIFGTLTATEDPAAKARAIVSGSSRVAEHG